MASLHAGAASVDITPEHPVFLYGYPYVQRRSTGVHDRLLSTAVWFQAGEHACVFIANDVIFIDKQITHRARQRIASATGVAETGILISATHTHSGPVTVNLLSNHTDPIVPPADVRYLHQLEDAMVHAATNAWRTRRLAEVGFIRADAIGIGTSRHDPKGASDLSVPCLLAREISTHTPIGLVVVCAMHPTVLHEDSTVISGDFPAFTRDYLQQHVVGNSCPIAYHTGAAGDQSPRHVVRANTLAEAKRLGVLLGKAIERVLPQIKFAENMTLRSNQSFIDLPHRILPVPEEAHYNLDEALARFEQLKKIGPSTAAIRTAECDWFGAQETLALSNASATGILSQTLEGCLPAEIQALNIGPHLFVAWPGEFFVEFALAVRSRFPDAALITMANGDLQGYVVSREAVQKRWYEASNALLQSPKAGDLMVRATIELLDRVNQVTHV